MRVAFRRGISGTSLPVGLFLLDFPGKSPVQHEHFSVIAHLNVVRFQIQMNDPFRMRKRNPVADLQKNFKQGAERYFRSYSGSFSLSFFRMCSSVHPCTSFIVK